MTPWKTPIIASKICPSCPQTSFRRRPDGQNQNSGHENCLCLNIYSTSLRSKAKLPVMVFIHGGAYKIGDIGVDPEFLADEVVLVDVNYRLGALGFSTTGDGVIPGNLGIKDQLLALKWVQKNIGCFGGNSKLVTVFGASAGSSSSHIIILSPRSKGRNRFTSLRFCACYRIIERRECSYNKAPYNEISSDIPWITGIVSSETLGLPSRFLRHAEKNNLDLEEQIDAIIPKLLQLDSRFTNEGIPSIVNRLKKFYFGNEPITRDNIFKMDDLVADIWLLSGLVESTLHYEGTTYLYYYNYHQSSGVSFADVFGQGISKQGVSHMDDLLDFFPLMKPFPNRTLSTRDQEVSENHVYLWTTFAKYGDLTRNNLTKWDPLNKKSVTDKYLYIAGPKFKQMSNLLEERTQFWANFGNYSRLV